MPILNYAYFPCKLHNHYSLLVLCKGDFLIIHLLNNIHSHHNEKSFPFLLLYIFCIFHNGKFSFSHIHHQRIYNIHKNSQQMLYHIFSISTKLFIFLHNLSILFPIHHICLLDEISLCPFHLSILHHHDKIYKQKNHYIPDI